MTTIFKAYLCSFIGALIDIFEMFDLNTDYLEDLDFTEYLYLADIEGTEALLLEEHGIEYLNEFNHQASDIFNFWYYAEKEFCEDYKNSSADSQEATFFTIIYYLMLCITHTSPAGFAKCVQESLRNENSDAYKALMLLKALEDAQEYIK